MFQDAFNCASLAVGCTLNVVDSVLTDEVYCFTYKEYT